MDTDTDTEHPRIVADGMQNYAELMRKKKWKRRDEGVTRYELGKDKTSR